MGIIWPKSFDEQLKLFTVLGVLFSFLWSVYQWKAAQDANAVQRQEIALARTQENIKQHESIRRESLKPFLELQLSLYREATKIVAFVATSENEEKRKDAMTRF